MDKITLSDILSGFSLTRINDNFNKVQDAINNKVLGNSGDVLQGDLDVNGKRLYNLPAPAEDSHPARLKDVKNAIAGLAGVTANLVGFTPQNGVNATNVQGAIEYVDLKRRSSFTSLRDYGAALDGVVDDTALFKKALSECPTLYVDGNVLISDELLLSSNQTVILSSRTKIVQTGVDKNIFKAVQADNVWIQCNGAVLYGRGTWSSSWTGISGHEDRAIQFIGCTRSGVISPNIKNCGAAGIAIVGGRSIKLIAPTIEGTHLYSTPLPSQANFQSGVYITDSSVYGKADEILIIAADISGVAQGILRENQGSALLEDVALDIIGPNIHDIPGQHAFYIQGGLVSVSNPTLSNIPLSGFKVQSADANQNINGFTCTGVSAKNVASNLFEFATIGTGSLSNINVSAVGDYCGTGISILGKVKNVNANIQLTNATAYAAYLSGSGIHDVDITVKANGCGQDGVLITCTNSDGIKIRPTIRNANTGNDAFSCGVRVASASAQVELFDPDVTDTNSYMNYGLFNSVLGSTVKVRGSAKFTGAKDTAVRATGLITEWPLETQLSGVNGEFSSTATISSSQPIVFKARSTSTTNVPLWYQSVLPDESAILVKAEIIGKLSGSSERRAVVVSRLFYRDGGNLLIEGAASVTTDIASAGFQGTYSLQTDGATGAVLVVNSGGSATYDWVVRVTVTKVF